VQGQDGDTDGSTRNQGIMWCWCVPMYFAPAMTHTTLVSTHTLGQRGTKGPGVAAAPTAAEERFLRQQIAV